MRQPLLTSSAGITHEWEDVGGGDYLIHSSADVTAMLDRNKGMATHNDGYTPSREMRRVAFIPEIIRQKWMNEEGWDAFNPAHADRLMRKLNDPDYLWLRTAEGRLGPTGDGSFR